MEVFDFVIKVASFLTAVTIIITSIKKMSSSLLESINEKIKEMDYNQSQNYLVDFLSDLEDELPKNECQIKRAYEVYDHYINDLGGNSYIKDKWDDIVRRD